MSEQLPNLLWLWLCLIHNYASLNNKTMKCSSPDSYRQLGGPGESNNSDLWVSSGWKWVR